MLRESSTSGFSEFKANSGHRYSDTMVENMAVVGSNATRGNSRVESRFTLDYPRKSNKLGGATLQSKGVVWLGKE